MALTSLYHMSNTFTGSQKKMRLFILSVILPKKVFVTLNGGTPDKNGVRAKPFTKMGLHIVRTARETLELSQIRIFLFTMRKTLV